MENPCAWDNCSETCKYARCCTLEPSDPERCSVWSLLCDHYALCSVLNVVSAGNDTITVEDVCQKEIIESSVDDYQLCESAESFCSDGLCCFLGNDEIGSCANDMICCEFFQPCSVLKNTTEVPWSAVRPWIVQVTHLRTAPIVAVACSADSLASDNGHTACLTECRDGGCCFLDPSMEQSCKTDNEFCNYYGPCAILLDPNAATETNEPESPIGNSTMTIIESACSPDSFATDEGRFKCANLCGDGACCLVEQSQVDSCIEDTAFCAYYDPCRIILELDNKAQLGSIPDTEAISNSMDIVAIPAVESNCTQLGIGSGDLTGCLEMCDAWACCYKDNPTCDLDHKDFSCQEIVAFCDNLVDTDSDQ
jgi:hypothetical protein